MSQKIQTTATSAHSGNPVRRSSQLLTNLFPVLNAAELSCSYRLWEVVGLSGDANDEFEREKMSLQTKVSRDVKGPAAIISKGDHLYVVVPQGHKDPENTYSLTPDIVRLKPLDEIGTVDFLSTEPTAQFLSKRLLQGFLSNRLWQDDELWQPKAGRPFYFKHPANAADESRKVDVFEGFAFRVVYVENVGYCVLIDCRTHFVSSEPWPRYIPFEKRWDFLHQTSDAADADSKRTTRCVYRFGYQWYEVFVQAILKENIDETLFTHPDTNQPVSVYDYTIEKMGKTPPKWCDSIKPDWTAITYATWKDGPKRHGAAHLCYPIVTTSDLDKMGLGWLQKQYSIKSPQVRLDSIKRFMDRQMRGTEFGDHIIELADNPLDIEHQLFLIPALEFGNRAALDISSQPEKLAEYPRHRLRILQAPKGGFWDSRPLQEQWILAPKEIADNIWPAFRRDLAGEVNRFLGGTKYEYDPQPIWYEDFGANLYQQVRSTTEAIGKKAREIQTRPSGYCLTILPANADAELPAYLTSTLSQTTPPLHVACVHLDSFKQFYIPSLDGKDWHLNSAHPDTGRVRGYIRNVAMKLLLLNNRWPFVFRTREGRPHNTLFIGFDVLNAVAGFTFAGNGGRICFFVPIDSEDRESISARKVRRAIADSVSQMPKAYNWFPERIVLVRDGRLFERELKGFRQAMQDLNIGNANAVEIPKHSVLGIRFFYQSKGGQVGNPRLGFWYKINEEELAICTTGWPFTIQGTSMPLTIRKKWGLADVSNLGKDMFDLAQLAWTAPDRPARYPLVIRYTDMRLRAIAMDFDEEETEFGPEEDLDSDDGSGVEVS